MVFHFNTGIIVGRGRMSFELVVPKVQPLRSGSYIIVINDHN